jgi:hypothetical protein
VVIWPEPNPDMGRFSILVTGLSGEAVILTDSKGETVLKDEGGKKSPVVLRKTLQLEYHLPGDGKLPQLSEVYPVEKQWVMR